MSIFRFPIEIADSTGERFQPVDAWVDTGASYTLVPGTLLEGLGHTSDHNLRFGKADGSITELGVSQVTIRINGETRVVSWCLAETTPNLCWGQLPWKNSLLA